MHSAPSAKQPLGTKRSRARDYRVVIKFERVVATTISARLKDDGNRPVIYPAHSDPQSRARAPATPGHFPPAFHAVSLPFLGRLPSRARFPRTSCLFTCSCGPESLWGIHREQSRRAVSVLLVFRLCFWFWIVRKRIEKMIAVRIDEILRGSAIDRDFEFFHWQDNLATIITVICKLNLCLRWNTTCEFCKRSLICRTIVYSVS